jgi:hypothetical protein
LQSPLPDTGATQDHKAAQAGRGSEPGGWLW